MVSPDDLSIEKVSLNNDIKEIFMKKKLLALAVTSAAVMSVSAHADSSWERASNGGTFNIGGTITVDKHYEDNWLWKLGSGITLDNNDNDLDETKRSLTVAMPERTVLLVGKSEAFKTPIGGLGASPQISFSDADGNPVTLQTKEDVDTGYASLTLPIKNDENATIGDLKLNVQALGIMYTAIDNTRAGPVKLLAPRPGQVFYGGLTSHIVAAGGSAYANKVANDGGWSIAEMRAKYNTMVGNPDMGWASMSGTMSTDGSRGGVYSYSLVIDQGQKLEATFKSPIYKTTQWSSPLKIAVTYN